MSVEGGERGDNSSLSNLRHLCPAVRGSHRRRVAAQQGARACARQRDCLVADKGWRSVQPVQPARPQRRAASTRACVQHPQASAIRRRRRRRRWMPRSESSRGLLCDGHEGAHRHRLRRTSKCVKQALRRERGANDVADWQSEGFEKGLTFFSHLCSSALAACPGATRAPPEMSGAPNARLQSGSS